MWLMVLTNCLQKINDPERTEGEDTDLWNRYSCSIFLRAVKGIIESNHRHCKKM